MSDSARYVWAALLCIMIAAGILSCSPDDRSRRNGSSGKVILTFDDAVRSQLDVVAPLLQELGFPATFFVTYAFMDDREYFLNWEELAKLDSMGFEIGNHSWTHPDFGQPLHAARLAGELGLVDQHLERYGIPKPISFAWTGNAFGPEALDILQEHGIRFARRGMQPEVPYGSREPGPAYDPGSHHPLLIPTTRDFYPDITFDDFLMALEQAEGDEIVVLQFHGVPDVKHPWVNTSLALFERCMRYLKEHDYEVLAMRDLAKYLPDRIPGDSLMDDRHVLGDPQNLQWPQEVEASRQDPGFWIPVMLRHGYDMDEIQQVLAWPSGKIRDAIERLQLSGYPFPEDRLLVLPYPGGRHPRTGFREGMLSPMRGTKLSVFLPWAPEDYVVLDLPEAVFSQFGLHFLGHTHIPTIWDIQRQYIENNDWEMHDDGHLTNWWVLPDGLSIGAEVVPHADHINMTLRVANTELNTPLTGLQTQICIMLKEAGGYGSLTNENKRMGEVAVAVRSEKDDPWILTGWDRCSHVWGNADCPCMHADPRLPDCAPGDTVSVTGKIWFYGGDQIEKELGKAEDWFSVAKQDPVP